MNSESRKYKLFVRSAGKSLFGILFILCSCTWNRAKVAEKSETPEKPAISYAKRFTLERSEGYSQLSVVNPWQGANNILQKWYLVPRGKPVPPDIDPAYIIPVPVKKIICMSTTHISMIAALGEAGSVTGFSGTRLIFDKGLTELVKNESIRDIGYDDNLNKELILKTDPDLIMVYGIGSESAGYIGKLKELGMTILYNADYLENDPLGKAEWIKLFGALYCKEAMADSIFSNIEHRYNQLKDYIRANSGTGPKVLLGLPFKDTWYISPGNSYISNLINDAGGSYLWAGTESDYSMPAAIETVYLKALSADFWLNIGIAESGKDIMSIDSRLADLPCFKNGSLFNNTKRKNENGGNDYWEGGTLNPDIILNDIASILHPGMFPGRELVYYKKLNQGNF
jgi:iron complex transport system substrate-binding protein